MVVAAFDEAAAQLEDRRLPTTTLDGWRRFVGAEPSAIALLPDEEWAALSPEDRRDYDDARIAHHAELVVVTTSAVEEITNEGLLLTLMNQREIGARRGLIVSGAAATGKTPSSRGESHPPALTEPYVTVSRLRLLLPWSSGFGD